MDKTKKLMEKAIKGDSSAYNQLYKMSRKEVYFTCLYILNSESDAEDIMQETFFTVMMKLSELKDKNKFQAWVNRIAANKCLNFISKNRGVSPEEHFEENGIEISDEEVMLPDEFISNNEKRKIIMDIIRTKLSDVQRQTIIMYYYNEMKIAEIAEIMGCSVNTAGYRLSAARKILKSEILKYEKENNYSIHSLVPMSFLTQLLQEEAQNIKLPPVALATSGTIGSAVSIFMQSSAVKITSVIAVAVIGGSAAGIAIHNSKEKNVPVNEYVSETVPQTTAESSVAYTQPPAHSSNVASSVSSETKTTLISTAHSENTSENSTASQTTASAVTVSSAKSTSASLSTVSTTATETTAERVNAIRAADYVGSAGDVIPVTISVDTVDEGTYNFSVKIRWDSGLEYEKVGFSDNLVAMGFPDPDDPNLVSVGGMVSDAPSESSVTIEVHLKIPDDAQSGSKYSISIDCLNFSSDGNDLDYKISGGSITVA